MALHEDLVIPQGKTWVGPTWALLGEDNSPMSMVGLTVKAQVRATARDAQVLHEWSTAAGNVLVREPLDIEFDGTTIATAGFALTVAPAVSTAWAWRTAVYDVEVTNPDGTVWGIVEESAVRVLPEVTR